MPIAIFKNDHLYFIRFSVNRRPRKAAFVVGNFTAFMKPVELEFCGSDYCAYISLPPGKYYYRYLVDGEVVLDNGPTENGFNVLNSAALLGGFVRIDVGCSRRFTVFSLIGLGVRGRVVLGIGLVATYPLLRTSLVILGLWALMRFT